MRDRDFHKLDFVYPWKKKTVEVLSSFHLYDCVWVERAKVVYKFNNGPLFVTIGLKISIDTNFRSKNDNRPFQNTKINKIRP